jgi:hypothetical protein
LLYKQICLIHSQCDQLTGKELGLAKKPRVEWQDQSNIKLAEYREHLDDLNECLNNDHTSETDKKIIRPYYDYQNEKLNEKYSSTWMVRQIL